MIIIVIDQHKSRSPSVEVANEDGDIVGRVVDFKEGPAFDAVPSGRRRGKFDKRIVLGHRDVWIRVRVEGSLSDPQIVERRAPVRVEQAVDTAQAVLQENKSGYRPVDKPERKGRYAAIAALLDKPKPEIKRKPLNLKRAGKDPEHVDES